MRVKTVSEYDATKSWLSMQAFDILLVDLTAEPLRGLDLLELGWRHSPAMTGGIFSFEGMPPDSWSATFLGARVFVGANALERIREFLSSFPKDLSLINDSRAAVLLVEDLDAARDIVRTYIESLGYDDVQAVGSAAAALDLLRAEPARFFCVVSDIHMPQVSGITLPKEIRKDPGLKHLPVIILTSDPTVENVVECVMAGASGFLAKPPKKAALLKELKKAKRMTHLKQSPRLCDAEDAHMLEEAATKLETKGS